MAAYEGADECADRGPVGGADEEASGIFTCRFAKTFQLRAMISLRETKQNSDLMHCPTAKSGNRPFHSAARVVQRQLRECLENRPWRGFAHVGVELGVPAQSAGHMRPNASVADPLFQRTRCGVFCLKIKCNWDGQPCRRARINVAINKSSSCQHSPR